MAILAVESRVHAVTVYRAGALVTRRATLTRLEDGYPEAVRVTGLPLALDDGSVRARIEVVEGGELPVATGLRIALDVPDAGAPTEPPQDAEIAAAKRRVMEIQARREQLTAELEGLRALKSPPRPAGKEGEPPPPVPTTARLALASFRHEELEKRQAEWRQSGLELQRAQEALADLEERKRRATTARPARANELRKSAVIALGSRAARAAQAWIDVEYLVPGARWLPAYALELDAACTRGTLAVRALVCQRTGEDWPGVALKLSTAHPQAWAELPELTSVRIGRRQPARRRWVPPPTGGDALYGDYDRARSALAPPPPPPPIVQPSPAREMSLRSEMPQDAITRTEAGGYAMRRQDVDGFAGDAPEEAMPMMMAESMPAPQAAPSMARESKTRASAMMSARAAPGARPPPSPARAKAQAVDAELELDRDLLEYGRLRMGEPGGPGRGALAPVPLSVQYLELLSTVRVSVQVDVMAAIQVARDAASRTERGTVPPTYHAPASVDGFDYAYRADFPLDVPSDGELHGVTLALRDGPVELEHVCVPRESADVFRVAHLANPLDAPLLAGPIDVTVAGEFRLTAALAMVPPRGRAELGLGIEPAIKVARNTRYREETAGLMSSTLTLHHEIAVDVVNHLPLRARIEVRERVPVALEDDDRATVSVTEVSPAWKAWEPKGQALRGGYAWTVVVDPGAKIALKANYNIVISSKHELVGGNRREG